MTETVTDRRRPVRSSIFIALVLIGLGAVLLAAYATQEPSAEMTFTPAQRRWLERERPAGRFVNDQRYLHCDDRGWWAVFEADGDWRALETRKCWWHQMPRRTPNPEYDPPGM